MTKFIELRNPRIKNLSGLVFDRLTVMGPIGMNKHGSIIWQCQCVCGNLADVVGDNMRTGHTRSCGCLQREALAVRTHGLSGTKIYSVWVVMIARCHQPTAKAFKDYGERGIVVCAEWRCNFTAFHRDVSALPHFGEKGYSLDRVDNGGNYEPGNVRWATQKEQCNNRRDNRLITVGEITLSVSAWAERTGLPASTVFNRLKLGWSAERAVSVPRRQQRQRVGLDQAWMNTGLS
jgi:hypothetical protein